MDSTRLEFLNAHFVPIEFLDWSCLTIGALGWGQIQLANSNVVTINPQYSRRQWMIELCDIMLAFYPREIQKIVQRTDYFDKLRTRWVNKPEQTQAE